MRSSLARCLDGWGAVESRCVCSSTYMTQWDDRTWGGRRGSDELHPVFCVDRVSDVLWFEATHEMESFSSLVAKQVSGTLREGLFQKEYLTEFLHEAKAISHSHGNGEKGSS